MSKKCKLFTVTLLSITLVGCTQEPVKQNTVPTVNPPVTRTEDISSMIKIPVQTPSPVKQPAPTPNQPPEKKPAFASASIANFSFSPATITVKTGTTITWKNQDSAAHTVTSDNGAFTSGNLGQGQAYSFTFSTAGTFNYHCALHPMMKGTVVVE